MPYKILSLDGCGTWALIQVRTLIALYGPNATGHQVLANFDLAAANSGGSLVLAGLVEDLSLSQIAQYFLDDTKRRSIFSPTSSIFDHVLEALLGMGPKYSTAAKLPALETLFPSTGTKQLYGIMNGVPGPGGAPVHLVITGFDYDRNRAVFFRSAAASAPDLGVGEPASVTLAEAVDASANPPVNYFDAPATFPGDASLGQYWDGAIAGYNNPALAAAVEALVLGQQATDLRILSLGTGNVAYPLAAPGTAPGPLEAARSTSGLAGDIKKLATSILDDPPDAATFVAHMLTGAGNGGLPPGAVSRIVRMNPLVSPLLDAGGALIPPTGWSAAQLNYLANLSLDVLTQSDVAYVDSYCSAWLADVAPNQPIRPDGATFDPWNPEIGYAKFSKAKAAWGVLF
jgi:uncharacterized protein